ncbi:hypothetical protein D3H35_08285 [Cohnella faecalis]|uniref:Uncharacterized protein n=1 Tax=Cohnella faecalis TaxID=2315694 RepID=A0A398CRV8_9BACL|nr:hypothetical protein D3H35_08285 [Cohnella faecalis]
MLCDAKRDAMANLAVSVPGSDPLFRATRRKAIFNRYVRLTYSSLTVPLARGHSLSFREAGAAP